MQWSRGGFTEAAQTRDAGTVGTTFAICRNAVTVAAHRLFVWFSAPTLPDHQVIAFAKEEESFFDMSSRLHEVWALAQGRSCGRRRAGSGTPTTCFETFPFPLLNPSLGADRGGRSRGLRTEVAYAVAESSEWTKEEEVLRFPGSVDGPWKRFVHNADARGIRTVRWPRIVAKDEESAKKLAKRTLTNLYNERPAWLDLAHRKLDEAVFAAYGWPADLTDEQILERLLALNLQRAEEEREG
ncbi:MAG: hypothetical protein R2862_08965 [Thermoanaerobaculia bacterium]